MKNKNIFEIPQIKFKDDDIKIYFSLKHFDYKDIDGSYIGNNKDFFKKAFCKIAEINNKSLKEIFNSRDILLKEDSEKCKNIVIRMIGEGDFKEKYNSSVYDLFRGNFSLRVFGVINTLSGCFYILKFDPTHKTR